MAVPQFLPANINGNDFSHCKAIMNVIDLPVLFSDLKFTSEEKEWKEQYSNSLRHTGWIEGNEKPPAGTIDVTMSQLALMKIASPGGKLINLIDYDMRVIFSNGGEKWRYLTFSKMKFLKVDENGKDSTATISFICDEIR